MLNYISTDFIVSMAFTFNVFILVYSFYPNCDGNFYSYLVFQKIKYFGVINDNYFIKNRS